MKDNTLILLLALAGVGGLLWWGAQVQARRIQPEPESPADSGGLGFSIGGALGLTPPGNPLPPIRDPAAGFGTSVGLDRSYYDFLNNLGGVR